SAGKSGWVGTLAAPASGYDDAAGRGPLRWSGPGAALLRGLGRVAGAAVGCAAGSDAMTACPFLVPAAEYDGCRSSMRPVPHRGGRLAVVGSGGVELLELVGDPDLQPAAVFPFVGAQGVDLALQAGALRGELAHHLGILALRLAVDGLGLDLAVPYRRLRLRI